jgi:hypothetical protein
MQNEEMYFPRRIHRKEKCGKAEEEISKRENKQGNVKM